MELEPTNNNTPSDKMKEFLDKVDILCHEYGFEIWPSINGWDLRKIEADKKIPTIGIIGNGERIKLISIDGDGMNYV